MSHPREVILTASNVASFPTFHQLFNDGKIVADRTGRLRYPHGAPVGKLIFVGVRQDGSARYKESAEEWFDPGSPMAAMFKWPE